MFSSRVGAASCIDLPEAANRNSAGVGFGDLEESSQKQQFPQNVTQDPTHSPAEVAHAARVLLLVHRIAKMPPDVPAVLFALFNSPLEQAHSAVQASPPSADESPVPPSQLPEA
ncbi:MAG: hypothetical protein ACK6CT_04095 [Planctomycetia bacterium]|jgi:hypothetical protein